MKSRKLVIFLILALIASGCFALGYSQILDRPGFRVRFGRFEIGGGHINLGSREYVEIIRQVQFESGNKTALNRVMSDVDKYENDIASNDYSTNLRLYKLISNLVYKSGSMTMEVHYFRNKLNKVPQTLNELLYLNSRLPVSRRWILLSPGNSIYHMQGKDGIYNLKFISADGFCEAVYNKDGILLSEKNDPVNMGTFNYAAGIKVINAHQKYDIAPYLKWGNTPDSPQKGADAINTGIKLAEQQYNMHSANVAAYRNKVFNNRLVKKS